jgi:hypothetical protein
VKTETPEEVEVTNQTVIAVLDTAISMRFERDYRVKPDNDGIKPARLKPCPRKSFGEDDQPEKGLDGD